MVNFDRLIPAMVLAWPDITLAFAPVTMVKRFVNTVQNSMNLKYKKEEFEDLFAVTPRTDILYYKLLQLSDPVPKGRSFLSNLIDFLENKFELPINLPMEYASSPSNCEDCL